MSENDKPFVVTGGADGLYKVLEHNPYVLDDTKPADQILILKLSDELDMDKLKSLPTDEVKTLFKEQITTQLTELGFDDDKVGKILAGLIDSTEQVEGVSQPVYDLIKLMSD
jgi:hypothetical protein